MNMSVYEKPEGDVFTLGQDRIIGRFHNSYWPVSEADFYCWTSE